MSGKVSGWVWDQDLDVHLKYVLLAYADHADHKGYNVFPSINLIAEKTGVHRRTVQRNTRQLEKLGYLITDGTGKKGTNQWRIPIDEGVAPAPSPPDDARATSEDDTGVAEGDMDVIKGVAPAPSEPSVKPSIKPSEVNLSSKEQNTWVRVLGQILNEKYSQRGGADATEYQRFWQPTELHSSSNGVMKILCSGEDPDYQRDWLNDRGNSVVERMLVGILGERMKVEFITSEENEGEQDDRKTE